MKKQHPLLNLKPQNLPVYVYHLDADIALVHDGLAYKMLGYYFSEIVVAANQPLRVGDVLTANSCYFGNENTEIIPHLQRKNELGNAAIELKHYYGCKIDEMAIVFNNPNEDYPWDSCGDGRCTVFIELSASDLGNKFRKLNNRDENKLTETERKYCEVLREEYRNSSTLKYWKTRIPDWDRDLVCIGEVPKDLSY